MVVFLPNNEAPHNNPRINEVPKIVKFSLIPALLAAGAGIGAGIWNMIYLQQCNNDVQTRVSLLSDRIGTMDTINTLSKQLSASKKSLDACSYFYGHPTTGSHWNIPGIFI